MKIYVGNLSRRVTEAQLRKAFEQHGDVSSVDVVTDRMTNRPREYAFVTMPDGDEAAAAIETLNGQRVEDRKIEVMDARESSAAERQEDWRDPSRHPAPPRRHQPRREIDFPKDTPPSGRTDSGELR